jgi:sortase A
MSIGAIALHNVMIIRRIERILLGIGLTLLAVWGALRFHGFVGSRAAIAQFHDEEGTTSVAEPPAPAMDPSSGSLVDFRLWSFKRIAAYKDSLTKKTDAPLAILRIPKINLEVPVFNDTDDLTLNRGVGRILGTARVGKPGNLGIAGHRDGFFRGLKDIAPGDIIELERYGGTDEYVVGGTQVVKPEDTSVLHATSTPTLTLVTCFPFYYVGSAPERFIVTASIQNSSQRDQKASAVSISTGKNTNNKEKKQ